ncbi:MAG: serine hydrolase domain-containing protein [Tunicatimonas sp.]
MSERIHHKFLLRLKRLFTPRTLVTSLFFALIYGGVPFSVSDAENLAFDDTNLSRILSSVSNITNEASNTEELSGLDQALQRFIQKQGVVGASVGIVKDGQLVYAKGFGHADLDAQQTVDPHHLFRIGSLSKLITTVAIMKLREEGKLSLDDAVFGEQGILNTPQYQNIKDPRRAERITVEHLLSHTAGWSKRTYGDPMFIPLKIAEEMQVPAPANLDDIISFVLSKRIPYAPGTRYDYSNFGFCLLGKVIEAASGETYERYVQNHLLAPLGIYEMRLAKNRPEDRFENEVSYYDLSPNNIRPSIYGTGEVVPTTYSFNVEALSAAGGWVATPTDLLRFLVAVDGMSSVPDILSNESLLAMIEPAGGRPYGWRGASVGGTWWRTGTLAGTSALMKRFDNGISWVVLTNTSNRRSDYFNGRFSYVLQNELTQLNKWPNHDLFSVAYY